MSARFKIHANKNATLSGIHYRDLRWILDAAAVSFYDRLREMKANKDSLEDIAEVESQIKLLNFLKESEHKAIDATYPPKRPPTKKERIAAVQRERHERRLVDDLVDAMLKERHERA